MDDDILKHIANTSEYDLQVILAKKFAWEFCMLEDPEFFRKRKNALQPIVDAFQYLVQSDQEPDNVPALLVERLKNNKYVIKFNKNPKNVAASLAPRSGKSRSLSICNAWALGKYPEESIMRVCHSQRLYNKFSRYIRSIIQEQKFQDVFPGIYLKGGNMEVAAWSLKQSKQDAFFGSGVGGGIVGSGASLVAETDDLYKSHNDAKSTTINESTLEFMDSAFDSRTEKGCPQFDVGTRWVKGDYLGIRLDGGEYDIIIIVPALDENDETFCEDVKTTEQYHNKRARLIRNGREHIWHAEYMQTPIDIKGLLFPEIKLKRFRLKDLNMQNLIGKMCFVDTADKGTDFYSAPLGYVFESSERVYDVYITKVIFTADEFKYTKPLQVAMINNEGVAYTYIETNKEGTLYVNTIREACKEFKIVGLNVSGQKETRILMEAEYILDFHFLEKDDQDDMYKAFFSNLTEYLKEGGNKHDDAPDSLSGLSKGIRTMFKKLKRKRHDSNDKQENE